jgi:hypothetical protein
VLAMANFVFTAAFTLEMLLKMIGLGAWNYLRDAWNLFDALVVAFSLVELVTELMARTSSGGLSALRCGGWLRGWVTLVQCGSVHRSRDLAGQSGRLKACSTVDSLSQGC